MGDESVGTGNQGGSSGDGNQGGESVATIKASYEARLSGLQSSNDKLRQENESLKNQLAQEAATHSTTKSELARLTSELQTAQGSVQTHETEKNGLKAQLNRAQAILEAGEGIIPDLVVADEDLEKVKASVEKAKKVHANLYDKVRQDLQANRVPANTPPRTSGEEMTPVRIKQILDEAAAKGPEAFEKARAEVIASLK